MPHLATRNGIARIHPTSVRGVTLHSLPTVTDHRGSLTFGEAAQHLPFPAELFFVVHGVPAGAVRGQHAHRKTIQFLLCTHGSCEVIVDDGINRLEIQLSDPATGICIQPMVWAVQHKYTSDAVLLVLASRPYDPAEYIRDYAEFQRVVNAPDQ